MDTVKLIIQIVKTNFKIGSLFKKTYIHSENLTHSRQNYLLEFLKLWYDNKMNKERKRVDRNDNL